MGCNALTANCIVPLKQLKRDLLFLYVFAQFDCFNQPAAGGLLLSSSRGDTPHPLWTGSRDSDAIQLKSKNRQTPVLSRFGDRCQTHWLQHLRNSRPCGISVLQCLKVCREQCEKQKQPALSSGRTHLLQVWFRLTGGAQGCKQQLPAEMGETVVMRRWSDQSRGTIKPEGEEATAAENHAGLHASQLQTH